MLISYWGSVLCAFGASGLTRCADGDKFAQIGGLHDATEHSTLDRVSRFCMVDRFSASGLFRPRTICLLIRLSRFPQFAPNSALRPRHVSTPVNRNQKYRGFPFHVIGRRGRKSVSRSGWVSRSVRADRRLAEVIARKRGVPSRAALQTFACSTECIAEKMPTLEITNFNIVLSVLGGWISLFGLVSYLCKEHFYLSEARELRPGPVRYDVMLATSCSCTSSSFASCALGEVRHTSPSG